MLWDKKNLKTGAVLERGVALPELVAGWARKPEGIPALANPATALTPSEAKIRHLAKESVLARAQERETQAQVNSDCETLLARAQAQYEVAEQQLARVTADVDAVRGMGDAAPIELRFQANEALERAQHKFDEAQMALRARQAVPVIKLRPELDEESEFQRISSMKFVPDELVDIGWFPHVPDAQE